jgi:hypothetical protein
MKISTSVKISALVASLVFASLIVDTKKENSSKMDSQQVACIHMPYCGGPDIFSPVLQPKDSKTETQDAKDEKLA